MKVKAKWNVKDGSGWHCAGEVFETESDLGDAVIVLDAPKKKEFAKKAEPEKEPVKDPEPEKEPEKAAEPAEEPVKARSAARRRTGGK